MLKWASKKEQLSFMQYFKISELAKSLGWASYTQKHPVS